MRNYFWLLLIFCALPADHQLQAQSSGSPPAAVTGLRIYQNGCGCDIMINYKP